MISNVTLPSVGSGPPVTHDTGKGEGEAVRQAVTNGKPSPVSSPKGKEEENADTNAKNKVQAQIADVRLAVQDINNHIKNVQRDLVFAVDESTREVVVKVLDRASGEVVRQVPAENVLKLSKQLNELASRQANTGFLVKDHA